MSLVQMINSLINDIGKHGLNESTIRSRLSFLLQHAEASDLDLQRTRADLKRLKKDAKAKEIVSKQDSVEEFEEGAKKILQLLFIEGERLSVEQMAGALGLTESMTQYHTDGLMHSQRMIEVVAWTPGGTMFMLTAKGRAYVVKNKLA